MVAAFAIVIQWRNSTPAQMMGAMEWAGLSLDLALPMALTLVALLTWWSESRFPRGWLFLAIVGWGWFAADVVELDDPAFASFELDDIVTMLVWATTIWAILPALADVRLSRALKQLLGIGLALQSIAFSADLGVGTVFRLPDNNFSLFEAFSDGLETLCLASYASGLALVAVQLLLLPTEANGQRLWSLLQSTPGRFGSIAWETMGFTIWRLNHAGGNFAGYYADSISRKLDHGTPHRTLGRHVWSKHSLLASAGNRAGHFAQEGGKQFHEIMELLPPVNGPVAEYGCGSLRVGQHFIRRLAPGMFWGLDITDRFYRDGLALLPQGLITAKAPHLHVIDQANLANLAAAKPALIYSVAVMKHVPRSELDTYWKNILSVMQPHTVAVVYFDMADREMRSGAMNWAYPEALIRTIIENRLPGCPVRFEAKSSSQRFAGTAYHPACVIVGPGATG